MDQKTLLQEWRKLYDLMKDMKELAPWGWMTETDIFGVQDPESGQLGFVSVMGVNGEHLAVAVYLGEAGFNGFWSLQQMKQIPQERFFEIPQLQASFEDREMLTPEDRRIIKTLGLSYRGRMSWPLFRSFRPGFFPWHLEPHEMIFWGHVLEQTLKSELVPPLPDLTAMWGGMPARIVQSLASLNLLPDRILVGDDLLYQLLAPLCRELQIKLQKAKSLPQIKEARASLLRFLESTR